MIAIHRYRQVKPIVAESFEKKEALEKIQTRVTAAFYDAEDIREATTKGAESIRQAARDTMRFTSELQSDEEFDAQRRNTEHAFGRSSNFVQLHENFAGGFLQGWEMLLEICAGFDVPEIEDLQDGSVDLSHRERLADLSVEYQLNGHTIDRFTRACEKLPNFRYMVDDLGQQILKFMEEFFNRLTDRHGKMGLKVWHTPILTDFAYTIFENIRHHGEVSKQTADAEAEISAYSRRKAIELISWIKDDRFKDIILGDTDNFSHHIRGRLRSLSDAAKRLEKLYGDEVNHIAALTHRRVRFNDGRRLDSIIRDLEDMDPNRVKARDISAPMTEEEVHELQFKNEVIGKICSMLKDSKSSPGEIAEYVWEKCKELRKHYLVDNSFFQCRIAQGNPMMGKGSGALEVVPGKKPYASFDRIVGEGFDEVKKFVQHIRALRKWSPLYLMTSPRKSVDRNNALLIGPQGCGKTECMRAVANEDDAVAIFAQGSDFLTAWMGEAQKNPKRLFEAAVKLHKESDRHVHILIDEIDSVLNNDWSTSKINLSLEFQMIMDGVVDYPGISVWGTTNHPERIPMPMIRRFSLVSIVGQLNLENRVHLLKQFMSVLPLSDEFDDEVFEETAKRLEGATGDVVRKVCEHVWRSEISSFIENHPEEADRMLELIKRHGYDPMTGKTKQLEPHVADREENKMTYGGSEKSTKREEFLKSFSRVFTVEPKSLVRAADVALDNIGIINEIETAKQTYADAEKFLAQVKEQRVADAQPSANA